MTYTEVDGSRRVASLDRELTRDRDLHRHALDGARLAHRQAQLLERDRASVGIGLGVRRHIESKPEGQHLAFGQGEALERSHCTHRKWGTTQVVSGGVLGGV